MDQLSQQSTSEQNRKKIKGARWRQPCGIYSWDMQVLYTSHIWLCLNKILTYVEHEETFALFNATGSQEGMKQNQVVLLHKPNQSVIKIKKNTKK